MKHKPQNGWLVPGWYIPVILLMLEWWKFRDDISYKTSVLIDRIRNRIDKK